jgi:hypothetical protein
MSIVVRFHPTNATKEKYDESLRRMEQAEYGLIRPGSRSTLRSGLTTTYVRARYGARASSSRLTVRS